MATNNVLDAVLAQYEKSTQNTSSGSSKMSQEDRMKKLDKYAAPEIVYERQYGIAQKPDTRVRTTPRGATVSNWDK